MTCGVKGQMSFLTEEGGLWVKKLFFIKWRQMTFGDT
jgi:hypothetical protein